MTVKLIARIYMNHPKPFFHTLIFFTSLLWASICHGLELEREERRIPKVYPTDYLTGNWGGLRDLLLEKGIIVELEYFGDTFANLSGGNDATLTHSGLVMFELYTDVERLIDWADTDIFISIIVPHGGRPTRNLSSVHAVSNLEAVSTILLFEAWVEKLFLDEQLSILAGLYAVDSEFDVQETASLFINDAFGTGLELAGTGRNGPSIYPVTSLGGRIKVNPLASIYLQTALLDGVPGDPTDPAGIHINLREDDGLFVITELGQLVKTSGRLNRKAGLGGWFYTTDLNDLDKVDGAGNPIQRSGSHGIYGFIEGKLFAESADPQQGLAGFLRLGYADDRVNRIEWNFHAGVTYHGLLPGRDDDVLGFGVSLAKNGDAFIASRKKSGTQVKDEEIVLEWMYQMRLTTWLSIKPDLQYFINPGTEPGADNAFLAGMRFFVEF